MKKLALLALLIAPLALEAQKPLEVRVQSVNDRRAKGFFAQLAIGLELPAIKASDVAAARVLVSTAVDDVGTDLVDREAQEPQLDPNMRTEGAANVSVNLKNPARRATKVKQVQGQIELYMPSKDPSSIAEIPKFISNSGKTLSHKSLKANGVEISLVGASQLAAEKKKRSDAKRKELQESGYEGESLEQMLSSYMEYDLRVEPTDVLARVKDPNKRIQEVAYVDAAGEVKRVMMRTEDGGYTILSAWQGPPLPDWKLRVSMKTPKNVVKHPFALSDVPLP